jgi:hypothetical protein
VDYNDDSESYEINNKVCDIDNNDDDGIDHQYDNMTEK